MYFLIKKGAYSIAMLVYRGVNFLSGKYIGGNIPHFSITIYGVLFRSCLKWIALEFLSHGVAFRFCMPSSSFSSTILLYMCARCGK